MPIYRRKPFVVEAFQWDGSEKGATDLIAWMKLWGTDAKYWPVASEYGHSFIAVPHPLDGTLTAGPNAWIIRSVRDLFNVCSDALFDHLYEEAPQ